MTVAPSIAVASSTESSPSNRGTRPPITPAGDGGETNRPARNPTAMISRNPVINRSNGR